MRFAGIAIRTAARTGTVLAWLLLAAIVLAVSSPARAGTALVKWNPPTTNEDGSALTDLAGYRLVYGTSVASLNRSIDIDSPGLSSYLVSDLAPGTYYFGVHAVNEKGVESALSNVDSKTIVELSTRPVYVIKQTRDNVALVVAGEVPADTACSKDKGVLVGGKAYYVVPRDAVEWSGSVRSEIVVAECD